MISGCFGLPAHGSRGRAEGRFSQVYQYNFLLNFHWIFMELMYVTNKDLF